MKPNTSNNEHFEISQRMKYTAHGFAQGYAKALADVTKILNREIKDAQESREDDTLLADMKAGALGVLEEVKQSIATRQGEN